ncbi:unnamed protein product [Rotaria socialis]|uniref:Major facilitator superfamily (MFS) profile domain-containing protein n=1 Tax=Rotaria socialis TaxID=392032 RepID=A0A817UX75_9BILA|nr:unnamed protein product [Rotaria socialis]CAF4581141.1 unnamed protein product [Rotaria socialis]
MALSNIYQQIPKRYVLSLLGFFGLFNAFVLRSNLSIAIVAMITPSIDNSSDNMTIMIPAVYNWSTTTRGYILASFFYGYCIAVILAGLLATRFGGRILLGGGVGLCACLTLFTPLCARNGSGALMFLRVLEGISSSCIYPSLHSIWSKWAPKQDKSKLATLTFSGAYTGTFVTMLFGGVIAVDWSWEWVFYLSGISSLSWVLIWFYFTAETPSAHTTISHEEARYIEDNIVEVISQKDTIPWKDILTSLPVWAIIAAHFGTNWAIYTMFTELPTFLVRALGFRVDTAGLLAALPWLLLAISVYLTGIISDKLVEKYSILYIRKFIMSISFAIIAFGFLLITVLDNDDRALIVIGITIVIGACGLAWASFGVNHLDIGGHYAAVLMGMSNCIGSTPGFIVPVITGYTVQNSDLKREWNNIFIIPIFISVAALMFYTFFGAGELQLWASNSSDEHQRVMNNPVVSRDISEHTTN